LLELQHRLGVGLDALVEIPGGLFRFTEQLFEAVDQGLIVFVEIAEPVIRLLIDVLDLLGYCFNFTADSG
jgi:hypothetical protein